VAGIAAKEIGLSQRVPLGTATAAHQVEGDNLNNDWWHSNKSRADLAW